MTGSGKTCSDISLNIIVDEGECKKAAEDLGRQYQGNEIEIDYPSGCYAVGVRYRYVYFNMHDSGTGNVNVKSICKQGVYQFIHNQSSSNNILCGKIIKSIFSKYHFRIEK